MFPSLRPRKNVLNTSCSSYTSHFDVIFILFRTPYLPPFYLVFCSILTTVTHGEIHVWTQLASHNLEENQEPPTLPPHCSPTSLTLPPHYPPTFLTFPAHCLPPLFPSSQLPTLPYFRLTSLLTTNRTPMFFH